MTDYFRPIALFASAMLSTAVAAQQRPTLALPMRTLPPEALTGWANAADIAAVIRHAESAMQPGQAVIVEPLWKMGTSTAFVEVRRGAWTAAIHPDFEMFYVVRGSGTLIMGGTIADPKPGANGNVGGTRIEGGKTIKVGAGDFFYVPEGTPHQYTAPDGELVLLSMHIPRPGGH